MEGDRSSGSRSNTHRHDKPPTRQKPGRKQGSSRPGTEDQPVPQAFQDDMKIKNPDIAFIFNPTRDQTKEYHLDGDSTMYTEQALAQRQAIKVDPQVVASINDFITLYKADAGGRVSKREYEGVQTKLCRILRPGMDPYEMKRVIDEDWKRDTSGSEGLTRELLFDSLFELCDVWCPNIDVEEYKAFFDQLKFRLRYDGMRDQAAYDILR